MLRNICTVLRLSKRCGKLTVAKFHYGDYTDYIRIYIRISKHWLIVSQKLVSIPIGCLLQWSCFSVITHLKGQPREILYLFFLPEKYLRKNYTNCPIFPKVVGFLKLKNPLCVKDSKSCQCHHKSVYESH
jgi:hypothetical protein